MVTIILWLTWSDFIQKTNKHIMVKNVSKFYKMLDIITNKHTYTLIDLKSIQNKSKLVGKLVVHPGRPNGRQTDGETW